MSTRIRTKPPHRQSLREMERDLRATKAFARLGGVSFLGATAYTFDETLRHRPEQPLPVFHTRKNHSIAVAHLAERYCHFVELADEPTKLACAAALLHDIGHPPLSHSMESAFEKRFGLNHHKATADVIEGKGTAESEVADVLRKHGLDPSRVSTLALEGDRGGEFDGFFGGPINFDTLDGVHRTLAHSDTIPQVFDSLSVLEASVYRDSDENDEETVDVFWRCKQVAYEHVVHSWSGLLADHAASSWALSKGSDLTPDDFYGTDAAVLKKLTGLEELLRGEQLHLAVEKMFGVPDTYTGRVYSVDRTVPFHGYDDANRYRRTDQELSFPTSNSMMRPRTKGTDGRQVVRA